MRRAPIPAATRTATRGVLLALLVGCGATEPPARPAASPGDARPPASDAARTPLPLDVAHTDVIQLTVCTLRKDRMTLYGGPRTTTPKLQSWADQAVVFDQHFAQAPWTKPSMGSLYTGRWPRELRLDNPTYRDRYLEVLDPEHVTLAEHLQAQGYATIGAVANPNLHARFGFSQGFDAYTQPDGTYGEKPRIPGHADINAAILRDLDAVPADQRVYVRAVYIDVHVPVRFAPLDLAATTGGPERVNRYDAALRGLDRALMELITEIRARRPNALVLLTADHGEGLKLPAHHGSGHGYHLYRTVTEVPWLLQHPALPGRRVETLSQNIDVVPTVLDLLGAPLPDGLDGRSQADAARGDADDPVWPMVFTESFFRRSHSSAVFDGDWHLIRTYAKEGLGGRHTDALFAASDRWAEQDQAQAQAAVAARLGGLLDAWEADQADQARQAAPAAEAAADPVHTAALQELGYLE